MNKEPSSNNKVIFIIFFVVLVISHISRLINNRTNKSSISASVEVCMLNTHSNHKAVANIGKAKNSFNLTIHVPELGRASMSSGL